MNLPRIDLKDKVLEAGSTHGNKENKFEKLELTPLEAKTVRPPLIKECFLNIECQVFQTIDVPEATIFLAKTTAIHYDEGVITDKGFKEDYKGKHNFVYYTDVRNERV
jgi:flavin reductase (DIM6/NTAB) family NADH-FMN oxidoreductase RutF